MGLITMDYIVSRKVSNPLHSVQLNYCIIPGFSGQWPKSPGGDVPGWIIGETKTELVGYLTHFIQK